MFTPCINIYFYTLPRTTILYPASDAEISGCASVPAGTPVLVQLPLIGRAIDIASDALILFITWAKTADIWRTRSKGRARFKLINLLLRDGTLYFCALLVLNVATLTLSISQKGPTQFSYVCGTMTNILISRFMLDLRGVYYTSGADDDLDVMSSLRFAGNLGAPLDINGSTWVTDACDEPTEECVRPHEESSCPMADGLFQECHPGGSIVLCVTFVWLFSFPDN